MMVRMEASRADPTRMSDSTVDPKGGSPAFGELFAQVYGRLRAMAQNRMSGERADHTMAATELVHEAYLRLMKHPSLDHNDRRAFFGVAAEEMRRILIDHARARSRIKRGGDMNRIPMTMADLAIEQEPEDFLALDEAIQRLQQRDARSAEVVRLRFYAGLSIDQTAEATNLSPRTVKREWEFARAWLSRILGREGEVVKQ
jgi:RNA polymerase sigma factor (TIGR02999 family)